MKGFKIGVRQITRRALSLIAARLFCDAKAAFFILPSVCVQVPVCANECEWVHGMFVKVFMAHMCASSEL